MPEEPSRKAANITIQLCVYTSGTKQHVIAIGANMKDGWISLHRKLQDNPIWLSEPFSRGQAWVDLLIMANHKENFFYIRGNRIDLKRGQLARSEQSLADRWKWSRAKVRGFLKTLEKEQQIEQQKARLINTISIMNYNSYQNSEQQNEQQNEQQKANRKPTESQQKDTDNKENNQNNLNKEKKDLDLNHKIPSRLDWKIQENIQWGTIQQAEELASLYGERLEFLFNKFNAFIYTVPDEPNSAFITWIKRWCGAKHKKLAEKPQEKPSNPEPKPEVKAIPPGEFDFTKWNGYWLCSNGSIAVNGGRREYLEKFRAQGEAQRQKLARKHGK